MIRRTRKDGIKTNKFLIEWQEKTDDSYADISTISGVAYDTVVKCFKNPSTVKALKFLKVCKALHIPYDLGYAEWFRLHSKRVKESCESKWSTALQEINKIG